MSSAGQIAAAAACYVDCNICNTKLEVSVPENSMLDDIVTVRCGHCTNLLPVSLRGLMDTLPGEQDHRHLQQENINGASSCHQQSAHLELGSSSMHQEPALNARHMDIAQLPSDLLVEVTANIARNSLTPLNDIINLRRSCKFFRDATAAREVGRCMAVWREQSLHWSDNARMMSLIQACAASDNPEASYVLGLVTSKTNTLNKDHIKFQTEFYNLRREASGLRYLHRAMERGHAAAAYMIGMITLHRSMLSGDAEQTLQELDWVTTPASTDPRRRMIASVRKQVLSDISNLTWSTPMQHWRVTGPSALIQKRGAARRRQRQQTSGTLRMID